MPFVQIVENVEFIGHFERIDPARRSLVLEIFVDGMSFVWRSCGPVLEGWDQTVCWIDDQGFADAVLHQIELGVGDQAVADVANTGGPE
jgi:hypothetical protein